MSTRACRLVTAAAMATLAAPAFAQQDPTDVNFPDPASEDFDVIYKNTGTVSTTGALDAKMNGAMKQIPGVKWNFFLGFDADVQASGILKNVELKLDGKHACKPKGHKDDAPSNDLFPIKTKAIKQILKDKSASAAVWNNDPHLTPHMDYYAVQGTFTNVPAALSASVVGTDVIVRGKHRSTALAKGIDNPYEIPEDMFALGAEDVSAAYDAAQRTLFFFPTPITILDSVGGLTMSVEPAFIDDAITKGILVISDLKVADEPNPDGTYSTSPGTVSVFTEDGAMGVEASFAELRLSPVAAPFVLGSFAELMSGSVLIGDPEGESSAFLQAFASANVSGIDVEGWAQRHLVLSLGALEGSLFEQTAGFTKSADAVTQVVTVAATAPIPDEPICLADFDANGVLNILDFLAYQSAWTSGDLDADLNDDGALNILDFLAYQGYFVAGCE